VGAKQALSKSFTADMQRTAILDKMDEKQLLELELEPEPVQSNANAVATIGSGELPTGCARPSPLSPPSPPSPLPALQPSRPPCHLRAVHSHLSVLAHGSVTRTLRHGSLPLDGANDARTSGVACVWGLKGGPKAAPALVCRRG